MTKIPRCDIDRACGTLPCTEGYKCEHLVIEDDKKSSILDVNYNRPKVLFINVRKAKCSIYESGLMIYSALGTQLNDINLSYMTIDKDHHIIPGGFDVYAFNYHPFVQDWLDVRSIRNLHGFTTAFVLEVAPDDPFVVTPRGVFDSYCVLDPTTKSNGNVYAFPRPLEKRVSATPNTQDPNTIIVGTFGFATAGKGFEKVVETVSNEFATAIIRINIPPHDVPNNGLPANYAEILAEKCRQAARPGIFVEVTHDYMDKQQLIEWCAKNSMNVFLYSRNIPGLAATTDQAISSGRALAVSTNDTFRHIHRYITPYPCRSLKESLLASVCEVLRMQNEWSGEKFGARFVEMLEKIGVGHADNANKTPVQLKTVPVYKPAIREFFGCIERGAGKVRRSFT